MHVLIVGFDCALLDLWSLLSVDFVWVLITWLWVCGCDGLVGYLVCTVDYVGCFVCLFVGVFKGGY